MRLFTFVIMMILIQLSCQHAPETVNDRQKKSFNEKTSIPIEGPSSSSKEPRQKKSEHQRVTKAKNLMAEGKFNEVVAILEKVISNSPSSLQPRLLMGGSLYELGKVDLAIKHLSFVSEKWPNETTAHLLLGYCFIDKKEYKIALVEFNKVLKLAEDQEQKVSSHLALASIYEELGNQKRANNHYDYALSIEPGLNEVLVNIQKEILWQPPIVTKGNEIGHAMPDTNRRLRIKEELKKILKGK